MKINWLLATSFLAASSLALTAWAGHHEGGEKRKHGHHFEKKDANGDGSITKEEWLAASEERFGKMDGDGDGSVTQAEWQSARERMHQRMRERHGEKHGEKSGAE